VRLKPRVGSTPTSGIDFDLKDKIKKKVNIGD
jgi:hypothetical protein